MKIKQIVLCGIISLVIMSGRISFAGIEEHPQFARKKGEILKIVEEHLTDSMKMSFSEWKDKTEFTLQMNLQKIKDSGQLTPDIQELFEQNIKQVHDLHDSDGKELFIASQSIALSQLEEDGMCMFLPTMRMLGLIFASAMANDDGKHHYAPYLLTSVGVLGLFITIPFDLATLPITGILSLIS